MSRLDTIRAYFIERFFVLLTSDPDFAGLTEPAELVGPGGWNVPTDASGFVRIPTLAALEARIAAATSPAQKEGLERFARVLGRTLAHLFGSLSVVSAETGRRWAARLAPVIRHPDGQAFWPVDPGRYLSVDDGTLRSRWYDGSGTQPLAGRLFAQLFEDPAAWSAAGLGTPPYVARVPFVATIGIDPSVPAFPASPLTAGHLDLPAADVRLGPGPMQPTIFVEMKPILATLQQNRHYARTAAGGGRFGALRHNRIHTDPLLEPEPGAAARTVGSLRSGGASDTLMATRASDPVMLVFHGFYPADDGARRLGDGTGTNREFHHLAVGLLMAPRGLAAESPSRPSGVLFTSRTPTEIRAIPLHHPDVRLVDDAGRESPEGSHPLIFATTQAIQGLSSTQADLDRDRLGENGKEGLDYDPEDWQWWAGLASFTAAGALAGAPLGPIGAAVGAAVGALVFLLAWVLKELFGGSEDRTKEWTESEPWPGSQGPSQTSFQQGSSHDLGPPGTTPETGGQTPGRAYALRAIDHFPDDNLYGLAFAGGDTFRIVDDPKRQETLAWHAFEGGIGYQLERPLPGRSEIAGTSMRSYFELFLRKYLEIQQAQAEVVYFGG